MSFDIQRVMGLATIQDLGVPGFMYAGMPPGGALVPELLIAANRSVDNRDGSAGIEVQGRMVIRARDTIQIAVDDQTARVLAVGDELEMASGPRRCAYLAVRGGVRGIDSIGRTRGALLCAGIGAPLRNETIDLADEPITSAGPRHAGRNDAGRFVDSDTIGVIVGPDHDAFGEDAVRVLTSAPYRISPSSNRVGTRLEGPALPRLTGYRERSRPMVKGALEVPGDGLPIVLGPEHPTTGGYPVIAVLATADLGRFFAIRLGGQVRFSPCDSSGNRITLPP